MHEHLPPFLLTLQSREYATGNDDRRGRQTPESTVVSAATLTRSWTYLENDNPGWSTDRNGRQMQTLYEFAYGAAGNYKPVQETWWQSTGGYVQHSTFDYNDGNGLLLTDVKTHAGGSSVPGTVLTHVPKPHKGS
ncbi:MAG: hypothetical protein R3C19_25795 [Planctomycetaceae bacterium]